MSTAKTRSDQRAPTGDTERRDDSLRHCIVRSSAHFLGGATLMNHTNFLKTAAATTALFNVVLLATGGRAAPAYLSNVPDWNQPTAADPNLPDPGPVNNVNFPAAGTTAAWCVPTTAANIAGYYRDTIPGLTIADGSVFPNTTARAPTAVDWRDDLVDDQSVAVQRQDFGWYFNTNNQGDANLQPSPGGTHYGNVMPGLVNYLAAHNAQALVVNFADLNGPAGAFDTSGVPNPHTVPMAFQRLKSEIDAGRPAILHLKYWSLLNRQAFRNTAIPGLPDYDTALWGAPVNQGPGGEVYAADIGHSVTVVGYWLANDVTNPFAAPGGITPDALIVYDNNDGTLLLNNAAAPLPLAVPFAVGNPNPGMNAPWVMQTEISGVPEPATHWLAAAGIAWLAIKNRRR
jgi:hypothetical protein